MDGRAGYIFSGADISGMERVYYDVVVVGTGIAGMAAALSLDPKLKAAVISKFPPDESSTYKAQGGIAIALGADDSVEQHIEDTLRVGRELCDKEAVELMVQNGIRALEFLQSFGVDFNAGQEGIKVTREAGHSQDRVVHHFDYTGRHISERLTAAVGKKSNLKQLTNAFLIDIATYDGECRGCIVYSDGRPVLVEAGAVILAAGGYCGLYTRSTNRTAGGDGIAAAYRAGAVCADMEFVQFHPTAFSSADGEVLLLTEALRGEGAHLLNDLGERFTVHYHPDGELAPRDVVARAIATEIEKNNAGHVWLDARHLGQKYLPVRFKHVYASLLAKGYDMAKDLIPVAPAAHYTIGGVLTDLWGRTSVKNLYACGETAATKVHGANRLASNSLLEGVVFGLRTAIAAGQELSSGKAGRIDMSFGRADYPLIYERFSCLYAELSRTAGLVRNGPDMEAMLAALRTKKIIPPIGGVELYAAYNACQVAELILEAALLRCESRGAHFRLDYPRQDDRYKKHILQQQGRKAVFYE